MILFTGKAITFAFLFFAYIFSFPALSAADTGARQKNGGGKELYLQWCSQCHGLEGRGDGVNATLDMKINPRDHTDELFMSTRTDENLDNVIKGGGTSVAKSPIMPPWRATFTDEEIKSLIGYLRKLCNCRFEGVVSDEKLRRIVPGFK